MEAVSDRGSLCAQRVKTSGSREIPSFPEGAMQFPEGKWGCVVAMLNAASKGRKAAFCDKTVVCRGGKAGLGFQTLEKGTMEYFLSTGEKGPKAGEFYKKSPQLARNYMSEIPEPTSKEYVVFVPLNELLADQHPDAVVCFGKCRSGFWAGDSGKL